MSNIHRQDYAISVTDRSKLNGHQPLVIWLTGLSGSGKSTIAAEFERRLYEMRCRTYSLDGDNVRLGLNGDLGFSEKDRTENIRRVAELSRLFADSGAIVTAAFISPFLADREMARSIVGEYFVEVYVSAGIDECENRDPKGLYKKARNGEIPDFTGIGSPYERPTNSEIVLDTVNNGVDECVDVIMEYLIINNILQ